MVYAAARVARDTRVHPVSDRIIAAAAARGAAATVAMSAPLAARWLARPGEAPPPMAVAENVQRTLGLEPKRYPRPLRHAAWLAAHLAFGSVIGAAAERWPGRAATATSAYAFGLFVWTANYAIGLPSLRLYPSPLRDVRGRAAASLLSHLVYAGALRRLTPE